MYLENGTEVSGRYVIQGKLGIGGMAVVYKARDTKLDRLVTLKVMRDEYMSDEEFLARFQIEARAAAGLSHTNIVNVYDVGQDNGVNYIVMEYIDGVTLKELIKRKAPFQNDETLGVAIQIASALSNSHAHGVIHRDIKPQNILVTGQGVIKVTDFGIARAAGSATKTTAGNTMGSVHYISPEQARGVYVDNKTDIYSLGIVMFEMATGQLPFDGESSVAVALKQIEEPLPSIKELNPNVSESLNRIIQKATSKNTSRRYQTIDDMLVDLKRGLSDDSGDFVEFSDDASSDTIRMTPEEVAEINTRQDDAQHQKHKRTFDPDEDYDDDDDMDYDEEKRLEKKIVTAAVITGMAIILIISAVWLHFFLKNKPKAITVPDVTGITFDAAQTKLQALGLLLLNTGDQPSDDVASGLIISQNEPVGVTMHTGDVVHVTVSSGPQMATVPNVVDELWNQAVTDIESASLKAAEKTEFSDTVPINVVISQDPAADSQVLPYTVVNITYSLGPEPKTITMPDVTGDTEADAINALQSAGLVVARSSKQYSATVPVGHVISQSIDPDTEINKGTEVSYVLSQGPPPATATPTPTPSPTPAPTPTVTPTPEPVKTAKTLIVKSSGIQLTFPAHIRINEVTTGGTGVTIFDQSVNSLPFTIQVSGTGYVEYHVNLVNPDGSETLLAIEPMNFDTDQ
jgi:serine/threonine-protein kinase